MLHFIIGALLVHLVPNIIMKIIKSTHLGHKLLTATFALGIEGKELSKMTLDIMTYVIGPESLVEYQLGKKLRNELSTSGDVDTAIESFRIQLAIELNDLSEEEFRQAKKTPFISSLVIYSTQNIDPLVNKISNVIVSNNSKRSFFNFTVYTLIAILAVAIDPAAILQPVICLIRKKVGTSEFGRNVLKSNFDKGIEGKEFSKIWGAFNDFIIAPSVLDTQRLGLYMNKSELIKKVVL